MSKRIFLFIALLPALASAEVQLYGTFKSGMEAVRTKHSDEARGSRAAIRDFGSHIGMRGSHQIGGSGSGSWDKPQQPAHSPTLGERLRQKKTEGFFRHLD